MQILLILNTVTKKFGDVSPIKFFIALATIFGLLFVAITPPFQAPDEPVHFFRAYHISTGDMTVDKVGAFGGAILPDSLEKVVQTTAYNPQIQFVPNLKYDINNTKAAFHISSSNEKRTYNFSTTAYYSPISYLPQTVGVIAGRVVSNQPIVMFYAARLANLAAWIVLMGLAIYLIPRKKWVLVFIGLIPMALFQAASLSADVMSVGLLAVFLSLILQIRDKTEKNKIHLISILIIALSLALSKQAMFIFLPLVLLIPAARFSSKYRSLAYKTTAIIGPMIIFGAWMLLAGNITFSTSVNGVDPGGQLHLITKNPFGFVNAAWNTYFYSWGDGIIKSFIGNFGWVDTPLAEIFVVYGYVVLFLLYFTRVEQPKAWLKRWEKWLLGMIALTYIAAITGALYLYFTPVGFKIVVGLVGRYYFPVALLLVPLTYSSWLLMSKKTYTNIAKWSPIILLTASTITIYVRYYINNV